MRHEGSFGGSRNEFREIIDGNTWSPEAQTRDRVYTAVARVDESLASLGLDHQLHQHENATLMPDQIRGGYEYFIEAQDIRRCMVQSALLSEHAATKWGVNSYLRTALSASKRISQHPQREQWMAVIDALSPPIGPRLPSTHNEALAAKTRELPDIFPRRIFFNALVDASEAYAQAVSIDLRMKTVAGAAYRASAAIDMRSPLDRPRLVSEFCQTTNMPQSEEMTLYDKLTWHFKDQESIRPLTPVV